MNITILFIYIYINVKIDIIILLKIDIIKRESARLYDVYITCCNRYILFVLLCFKILMLIYITIYLLLTLTFIYKHIYIPHILVYVNTIVDRLIPYFPRLIWYDGSQQYGWGQLFLFIVIFVMGICQ